MTAPLTSRRKRLRLGPLLRVLLPSLATLILIVLLLFTMFFTEFNWMWVTFLSGILFASTLSLVSASWKSSWRIARRTAEAIHAKQRLSAEIEQHRQTRERLEREQALHHQDRTRLTKESEAHRVAAAQAQAAETLLGSLQRYLEENAFVVDRDRRYCFHTKKFADQTGVSSERINGLAFEEALPSRDAQALRAPLLDALDGRSGRAELMLTWRDGTERAVAVDYLPQRDASGQIAGALVLIKEAQAQAGMVQEDVQPAKDETEDAATGLIITDESGNAVYFSSLTEELTGWGNPRERLRRAIQEDGFDLYAQDILALRTDVSSKSLCELLIRMRDEEQNMVPPGTFLPIAERFGMMPDIDRIVVRKAIAARLASRPPADAASAPVLCINLARASMEDRSFPQFVARALGESGVPGQALCFEIAEGDAIECKTETVRFTHELRQLGCRFTLDGFGRSGVGFNHLKALPLDFLKIDGRIVLQILRVPEALAKVRAIQRVCEVIGIRTIAEMVESEESIEKLRGVGVDYAQGFGIAPVLPF